MHFPLAAALLLNALTPISHTPDVQGRREACFASIGVRAYFGSAEQLRELQKRVKTSDARTCPQVGFRFTAGPRTATVLYDRTTRSIVRVGRWQGESRPRWEYWSGATDASILQDDPDDGFDAGQYHEGVGTEGLVPTATRRTVGRLARV